MATGCYLSIDDFNRIAIACKNVSHVWDSLAMYLDIHRDIVLSIQREKSIEGVDSCLNTLLTTWLRQPSPTQPKPSWRILRDAVSNIDRSLSEKIWTDHTSGCDICGGVQTIPPCATVAVVQQSISDETDYVPTAAKTNEEFKEQSLETDSESMQLFNQQTRELVHEVFYSLLAKEGNFSSHATPAGRTEPQLKCIELQKVYQSIVGACKDFLTLHGDELRIYIDILDMSEDKVYDTFHEIILKIFNDINWGRIVSVMCVATTMASRAIKERRMSLVESLESWLQIIVKERLQDWIEKQGGWVKFPDKFSPDQTPAGKKPDHDYFTLVTLAAAGLAFMIGFSVK